MFEIFYCTIPLAVGGSHEKVPLAPGNNEIAGFVELTQMEKEKKTRSRTRLFLSFACSKFNVPASICYFQV